MPDPTDPQSYNRYAYANNNPLKYVDPSGHASFDMGDDYNDFVHGDDKPAKDDSKFDLGDYDLDDDGGYEGNDNSGGLAGNLTDANNNSGLGAAYSTDPNGGRYDFSINSNASGSGSYGFDLDTNLDAGLLGFSLSGERSYGCCSFGVGLEVSITRDDVEPVGSISFGAGKIFSLGVEVGEDISGEIVFSGAHVGIGGGIGTPVSISVNQGYVDRKLSESEWFRNFQSGYAEFQKKAHDFVDSINDD